MSDDPRPGPVWPGQGDPDDWRRPGRWLEAVWSDSLPDPKDALRGKDARHRLDAFDAAADWLDMAMDPEVRAIAALMREVRASIVRGDKDGEGRAIPAGRILGIQPSSGATATQIIALDRRDRLLREARAAVSEWAEASVSDAAEGMMKSFNRYCVGGWKADMKRDTAPALAPASIWWRLLRLGVSKPMPGIARLKQILDPQ